MKDKPLTEEQEELWAKVSLTKGQQVLRKLRERQGWEFDWESKGRKRVKKIADGNEERNSNT